MQSSILGPSNEHLRSLRLELHYVIKLSIFLSTKRAAQFKGTGEFSVKVIYFSN